MFSCMRVCLPPPPPPFTHTHAHFPSALCVWASPDVPERLTQSFANFAVGLRLARGGAIAALPELASGGVPFLNATTPVVYYGNSQVPSVSEQRLSCHVARHPVPHPTLFPIPFVHVRPHSHTCALACCLAPATSYSANLPTSVKSPLSAPPCDTHPPLSPPLMHATPCAVPLAPGWYPRWRVHGGDP